VRTGFADLVEGERKTSYLFLDLLDELRRQYPQAPAAALILDNSPHPQSVRSWRRHWRATWRGRSR